MRPIEETGYLRIAQMRRDMRSYTPPGYKKRVKVPGRRWRQWLADRCWDVLVRLRALDQFIYSEEVATYTQEQAKAVTDALLDDITRVIHEYAKSPDEFCIVMGGQTFREFCDWYKADYQMMPVPLAHFRFEDPRRAFRAEFRGSPVYVVPWLKGCAVLPKAIIVKEVDPSEDWRRAKEGLEDAMRRGPGAVILKTPR